MIHGQSTHCLNCNAQIDGMYCQQCGQKTKFERISFGYLWHQVFHFFTHIEKGFLYTTWRMLVHPGEASLHYINGIRKRYQSPVSYFLIWTSIFILTLYVFIKVFGESAVIDYREYFGPGTTTTIAISNLTFMLAFIIPFQALYVYLIITRKTYLYLETVAIMIYVIGTIIFLQFIFALISLVVYSVTGFTVPLQYSDIFKALYFIWFIISLLRAYNPNQKVLKGLVLFACMALTFAAWRFIAVPWIVERFFLE